MKVYIKNKFVSLGGSSFVLDEFENQIYKVKGKVFSITKKKKIYDMNGNLLFIVRNKWLNFFRHRAYILNANKERIATVKDKVFDVKGTFYVDDCEDNIRIEGKFLSSRATIVRNDEVIGEIKREIFTIRDAFELDANEEDIPFLVALIIAIDNIIDNKQNDSK